MTKGPHLLKDGIQLVRRNKIALLEIALLAILGTGLRFVHLGYSNLQGDEIGALCHPSHFSSLVKFAGFLLGQQKGPVQYVITCTIGLLEPTFPSELALRLPFAAASTLALVCLFVAVSELFNLRSAVYATLLVAVNSIFVAFGRIVQYQSFVVLGSTASIMGLALSVRRDRWRVPGLYLGYGAAAMALLAHFDAVFVLAPLAILTWNWWSKVRRRPNASILKRHLLGAWLLFLILVVGFYLEYAHHVQGSQLTYWENRFRGTSTDTLKLVLFYMPSPFVWMILGATLFGLIHVRRGLEWLVLMAWLIPPLIFYELVFGDSRTHAYMYFLPALVLAGIGFDSLLAWIRRATHRLWTGLARGMIIIVLLLEGYSSFRVIVDPHPEYPWWPKTVLGINMQGGYFVGTFGFPYNRDWRAISYWFASQSGSNLVVSTNEKLVIADFYLPDKVQFKYIWRDAPEDIPETGKVYFVMIRRPQSWVDQLWGRTFDQWQSAFPSAANFTNEDGDVVASVYVLTMDQYLSATDH